MRDIKDCTAEVFRRSENRIKIRKQRRMQVVLYVIPLMVVVFSIAALRLPVTQDQSPDENIYTSLTEDTLFIPTSGTTWMQSIDQLEIMSQGELVCYSDPDLIKKVSQIINELMTDKTGSAIISGPTGDIGKELYGTRGDADYTTAEVEHYIRFVLQDGKSALYLLRGNKLANLPTDCVRTLTSDEANELKNLLGIKPVD